MAEPVQPNPWPKRILWIGIAAMLGGMIGGFTQLGKISEVFDPREMATATIVGQNQEVIEIESGCWIAFHEDSMDGITVNLHMVEGGAGMSDQALNSTSCPDDFDAMSTDGTTFVRAGEWDFSEGSTVVLIVECEQDCADSEVHFVRYENMEEGLLSAYGLWAACGVCMLGIILVPLGGMIMMMNKGSEQNVVIMNAGSSNLDSSNPANAGGGVMSTDEVFRRINSAERPEVIKVNEEVPDPFVGGHSLNPQPKEVVKIEQIEADDSSWKEWDES